VRSPRSRQRAGGQSPRGRLARLGFLLFDEAGELHRLSEDEFLDLVDGEPLGAVEAVLDLQGGQRVEGVEGGEAGGFDFWEVHMFCGCIYHDGELRVKVDKYFQLFSRRHTRPPPA
jgi:hypothetical protein